MNIGLVEMLFFAVTLLNRVLVKTLPNAFDISRATILDTAAHVFNTVEGILSGPVPFVMSTCRSRTHFCVYGCQAKCNRKLALSLEEEKVLSFSREKVRASIEVSLDGLPKQPKLSRAAAAGLLLLIIVGHFLLKLVAEFSFETSSKKE